MSGTAGVSGIKTPPKGESGSDATETGAIGRAIDRGGVVTGAASAEGGDHLDRMRNGSAVGGGSSGNGYAGRNGTADGSPVLGALVAVPVRRKDAAARLREDGSVGDDASPMCPAAPDPCGADGGDPSGHGVIVWRWLCGWEGLS